MAQLSPGAILSHYRIVSNLGASGMGEVYLAQDTRLDRKVPLKVLRADLALNHDRMLPNIAFALDYSALEDKDKAVKWLEKDFAERSFSIMVCCAPITRRFTR